jgi:hypothetical protein
MIDILDQAVGNDILSGEPELEIMADGSGSDTLVIDPSTLSGLGMIDVIPDFESQGTDTLDLSAVLDGLGSGGPVLDAVTDVPVSVTDGAAGGAPLVEVATFTEIGIGSVMSILYDDAKPVQSDTVT